MNFSRFVILRTFNGVDPVGKSDPDFRQDDKLMMRG